MAEIFPHETQQGEPRKAYFPKGLLMYGIAAALILASVIVLSASWPHPNADRGTQNTAQSSAPAQSR